MRLFLNALEKYNLDNFERILNERNEFFNIHSQRSYQISALLCSLESLKLLARGCKNHPSYRAIVAPKVKCTICHELYLLASEHRDDFRLIRRKSERRGRPISPAVAEGA